MARLSAVASVVVFGMVAIFSPMPLGSDPALMVLNRVAVALIGVVMAAFLWRYARIRAVPGPRGLRVVNLFSTTEVEWAQVLRVGFSGGASWAVLELTDTDELAVMAIQRADGEHARREASRLAALVEHHHRTGGGGDAG
ncbi:PH domain-containing protein [Ornithinimicrobium kibberense]|uniref:PH domain-containing protein n=1 Tax=Ornithinimicrobium kibberense TaxID=282060 RepID=UPI0036180259